MTTFMRTRRGSDELEKARVPDRYTPEEKSNALTKLSGAVVILRHPYERCSYSGAGNCWCGRAQNSSLHEVELL
jgi:hypothetical protein